MNLILIAIAFFGWMGGTFDAGDVVRFGEKALWSVSDLAPGAVHAQAEDPNDYGAAKAPPLSDSSNWGAMIVFAVGIAIFIVAYLFFRQAEAPTKKKKKKKF